MLGLNKTYCANENFILVKRVVSVLVKDCTKKSNLRVVFGELSGILESCSSLLKIAQCI